MHEQITKEFVKMNICMSRFGVRTGWRKYLYECTPFGYVNLWVENSHRPGGNQEWWFGPDRNLNFFSFARWLLASVFQGQPKGFHFELIIWLTGFSGKKSMLLSVGQYYRQLKKLFNKKLGLTVVWCSFHSAVCRERRHIVSFNNGTCRLLGFWLEGNGQFF